MSSDKPPSGAQSAPGKGNGNGGLTQKDRELWVQWMREFGNSVHVTPWLLMRVSDSDLGVRPLAPGTVFWESPDIWIESSDALGRAVPGEDNYVHARIFNLGMFTAAPTRVEYYWGDPSVGLEAADMHLIGAEWLEIDAQTYADVRCSQPWVPTYLNGGHECIIVNCSAQIGDPILNPFHPTLDRHVGQRNVTVLKDASEAQAFSLWLGNLFGERAEIVLQARTFELHGLSAVDHLLGALHDEAFRTAVTTLYKQGSPPALLAESLYSGARHHERSSRMRSHQVVPTEIAVHARETQEVRYAQHERRSSTLRTWHEQMEHLRHTHLPEHFRQVLKINAQPYARHQITIECKVPRVPPNGAFVIELAENVLGLHVGGYTIVALGEKLL